MWLFLVSGFTTAQFLRFEFTLCCLNITRSWFSHLHVQGACTRTIINLEQNKDGVKVLTLCCVILREKGGVAENLIEAFDFSACFSVWKNVQPTPLSPILCGTTYPALPFNYYLLCGTTYLSSLLYCVNRCISRPYIQANPFFVYLKKMIIPQHAHL